MFYNCFNVVFVTVSADLHNACAEFGINVFFGYDGDFAVHEWDSDFSANVFAVAFVFWVNFDGDAGRDEFGA